MSEAVHRPLIAVATYRRAEDLSALLKSLALQTGNYDVRYLVVDNDANGSAAVVVHEAPLKIDYVVEPVPGIVAARNRALDFFALSDCDCIVFIDDDETADEVWLLALLSHLNTTGADAVTGPVITIYPDDTPKWISSGGFMQRRIRETGSQVAAAATNNTVLRRASWVAAGEPRFDPSFSETGGSDWDFFRRLHDGGAVIGYTADAVVREGVPRSRMTARWLLRRGIRNGVVNARLLARRRTRLGVLIFGIGLVGKGALLVLRDGIRGKALQATSVNRALDGVGHVYASVGGRVLEYKR